jgi:micrococcal nuclease
MGTSSSRSIEEAAASWNSARLLFAVVTCALLALASSPNADDAAAVRLVVRVIDGDTLELDGGGKVRLIGVDTPETVHPRKPVEPFGREAPVFTKRTAEGQRVRLEGDPGSGSRDRYGRTLAYVYLADGRMLNLEIVRQGYGSAYVKYPFTRMEEFRAAQREARENGRGLWGDSASAAPGRTERPLATSREREEARPGGADSASGEG